MSFLPELQNHSQQIPSNSGPTSITGQLENSPEDPIFADEVINSVEHRILYEKIENLTLSELNLREKYISYCTKLKRSLNHNEMWHSKNCMIIRMMPAEEKFDQFSKAAYDNTTIEMIIGLIILLIILALLYFMYAKFWRKDPRYGYENC